MNKYLRKWVHNMLDTAREPIRASLESWLEVVHKVNIGKARNPYTKLRQTRLNWIDWMINELETGK